MVKGKKIIITIILIAALFILAGAGFVVAMVCELRYGYDETTDINAFSGREGLYDWGDGTDYFSYLLGFPEETDGITIEEFLYREERGLFDTPYQIFLRYTMSEKKYTEEKERLSQITMSYKGNEQQPIYIEDIYEYPICVLAYEPTRNYEYVILNDDKNQITCVFLQMTALQDSKISTQYIPNPEKVLESVPEMYSIYYFEDGQGGFVMPNLEGTAVYRGRILLE